MVGQCNTASTGVTIDTEQRRALGILKQNGLMTIPGFAAVMWLANPDVKVAEQMLNDLCRAGLVEQVLRPVGPLRFGLSVEGLNKAWM